MKFCKVCEKGLTEEMNFCNECAMRNNSIFANNEVILIQKEESENTLCIPSHQQNKSKKRPPKWFTAAGTALVLALAVIAGGCAGGDGKEQVTSQKQNVEAEPPAMTQEDVSALFPNWQLVQQETVNLNGKYYTVLAVAQNETKFEESVKIVTIKYDKNAKDSNWEVTWESQEYNADPNFTIEKYIRDFHVLNPKNASVALVVFNLRHAGNAPIYVTSAIKIDEKGSGKIIWEDSSANIEKKKNSIVVIGLGKVEFTIKDDEVNITKIPRSEVGSESALKIGFTLNSNGVVVPVENEEIYVKIGQPITFVPADIKTKMLFDKGEIRIHYSAMQRGQRGSVAAANANLVYAGNEFSFDTEDTYGFLLVYEGGSDRYNHPPYTFLIHAGDGKKPADEEKDEEKKAKETNKDKDKDEKITDLPSSSDKIIAPFPIGTTVSELKAHYGEPTFDDFWDGARVVFFDDEGYIIDWDEKVYGYWFASPKLSVFGATVGMTVKEINKIYGENAEPSQNELSGLDEYSFGYYKNGYKIIFYSEEKYGPTTDVKVIWEYWN